MSSEWTGPTPIAQEYPKGNIESNGILRLVNMVLDLRRDLRESTSNLLSTAGIFLSRTGMRIASALMVEGDLTSTGAADITGTTHIGGATDIDGTLNVDAATTIGGTLGVTGVTTLGAATSVTGALNVSGPMAVTGTLSLPAGIIDNDALTNPVELDRAEGTAANFAVPLTSAPAEIASCTFVVPSGMTKMQFTMIGTCRVLNNSASTQYVYLGPCRRTNGGTVYGNQPQQIALPAGYSGTLIAPYIFADDVVSGDSVEFFLEVSASATLAADAVINAARTEVAFTLTR